MTNDLILALLGATPGWNELAQRAGIDPTDVRHILTEAERFAASELEPVGRQGDLDGCQLVNGRVATPAAYPAAYRQMAEAGWIAPDLAPEHGGQGLPLALQAAASLHFEGAATAFMMAPGASRAAAHLLSGQPASIAQEWARALAAGDRTATICISEPDAGSDVARIRTTARPRGDRWQVDGTKCWISFGDHDMTERIGHLLLARTGPPQTGTRGLSLFLVPNTKEDGSSNGIGVERIEDKMGLHGSPTCVLRFDGAESRLIGTEGRGLSQLFDMIELMRLQVACQGAGIALRAAELARRYAEDRRQGGAPDAPPPAIATHPDVRRQQRALDAHACILVATVLEVAVSLERARQGDQAAATRASFLLPLAKTFGGELAFEAASMAVQILGGAGYTRDWPAERYLRDARVLTIYEGTTGMQAQDFLLRRLIRDDGAGLAQFIEQSRSELASGAASPESQCVEHLLDSFADLSVKVTKMPPQDHLAVADAYLRAGWCVVSALFALRAVQSGGDLRDVGRHWLATSKARMTIACDSAAALD